MKPAEDFVFAVEDEVRELNYEQIIGYLQEIAKRQGYEPCDFNPVSGHPNIYLRGLYEIDLRQQTKELTGKSFLMYTRKIANRASGRKNSITGKETNLIQTATQMALTCDKLVFK